MTYQAPGTRGADMVDKPNASVIANKSRFDRATLIGILFLATVAIHIYTIITST